MPHRRGLASVLHSKMGLEPWTTIDDVGTDCSPPQRFTPEDLKPAEDSSQESAFVKNTLNDLGFNSKRRAGINSKLVTLENIMGM